jgi:shikimate kinase / 3-dehydroquinate synthase
MAPLVALTGFMASGKTSVGARVAGLLGWRFVDLDEEFVRAEGGTIPGFFATNGEAAFRARECRILEAVVREAEREAASGLVVALGGGTLESPGALSLLRGRAGVVFLDVDPVAAWTRVQGTDRPLAGDLEQFKALLAERRATYEGAADWVLPVGERSVDDLSRELASILRCAGEYWSTMWGRQLVSTGRPSSIFGGKSALGSLSAHAASAHLAGSRLFVITDENVMAVWGDHVLSLLDDGTPSHTILVIEPGEGSKSAGALARCWDWLAEQRARRGDTVVALGGGVVGDLAGFVAATYHRGMSLWQIPTSLLAQVDSSVGGKTAINLSAGKNLVGAFYQPDLVVADPATLSTLPDDEYVGGLGEVVKYGLLAAPFFGELERDLKALTDRDSDVVGRIVKNCIAFKARVVEEDELDTGRRAVLNLGHTTAHALEVTCGYGSISHGRAVGLGLLVALAVSERLLGLDPTVSERTRLLLAKLGLPTATQLPDAELFLTATTRDKKVAAGFSGFVGLRAMGDPVWALNVPNAVLVEALEVIRA